MSDGFFSDQWYRVAGLRPRLPCGLSITRQRHGGWPWYVLSDPLSGKSHRVSPNAYALIKHLDGRRTLGDAWEALSGQLGEDAPGQPEVMQLVAQMHAADLLQADLPPDIAEAAERRRKQDRQVLKQNLMGPMSFRVPLFDPDRLLELTTPFVRWLIGPIGVLLWLWLVVVAGLGAIRDWEAIRGALTEQVLSAGNLALIAATYVPIKLLHEFGHGWVAKRYGVDVHETGLMFLVFMPVPYVDITGAAALPSKWQRIFVSAAGIMVETTLAAGAFLIWQGMEPGLERALLYNVMLIGGLSTVLVNGNPLLRFDGYFILADLLEIPNLAQRANAWIAEHWQRRVFGAQDVVPKPATRFEAVVFALYAPAAFAYRIFISITIAFFLISRLFGLGVLFALWSFVNVLGKPLGKAFWTLATGPRLRAVRGRAWAVTGALTAAVALVLFAVPVPWATRTMGVVWLPETAALRSEAAGVLAEFVATPSQTVAPGALVARLDSDVARAETQVARARVAELRRRLDAESVTDPAQARLTRIEYDAARGDLERAEEKLASLEIRAATGGRFEPRLPPHDMTGRYVRRGEEIGHVLPDRPQIVRYVVPQGAVDAARTRLNAVELRLPHAPSRTLTAEPLREVPAAGFTLPSPALGSQMGGSVPVDPSGEQGVRSLDPVFQFEAALPPETPPRFGGRVHVRLDHGSRPAGLQLADWLGRLFLRGLDV